MAGIGNQLVSYSYEMEATSQLFNNLNYGILHKGVYSGAEVSKAGINETTQFTIAPGVFLFSTDIHSVMSKVSTTDIITVDKATYGFDEIRSLVVARFSWVNSAENYMVIKCVDPAINEGSDANLHSADVILCKLSFTPLGALDTELSDRSLFNTETRTVPFLREAENKLDLDNFKAYTSPAYGNNISISRGDFISNKKTIEFNGLTMFPTNAKVVKAHDGLNEITAITQTGFTPPTPGTHRKDLVYAIVHDDSIEFAVLEGFPVALSNTAFAPDHLNRLVVCEIDVRSDRDFITPQDITNVKVSLIDSNKTNFIDLKTTDINSLHKISQYTFNTTLDNPVDTPESYGLPSTLNLVDGQVITGSLRVYGDYGGLRIQRLDIKKSNEVALDVAYTRQWSGSSFNAWVKDINQSELVNFLLKENVEGLRETDNVIFKNIDAVADLPSTPVHIGLLKGEHGDEHLDYYFKSENDILSLVSEVNGTETPLFTYTPSTEFYHTDRKVEIAETLVVDSIDVVTRLKALEDSNYVKITDNTVEITDTQSLVISPARNAVFDSDLQYIPERDTAFTQEVGDPVYDNLYQFVKDINVAPRVIDAEDGELVQLTNTITIVKIDCTTQNKNITIDFWKNEGQRISVYPTGGFTCYISGLGLSNIPATSNKPYRADVINDTLVEIVSGSISEAVAISTIMLMSGDVVPTGCLLADGSAYNRVDYPLLNQIYSDMGYPYGDGDGSTTFNIPDFTEGDTSLHVIKARHPYESFAGNAQLDYRLKTIEDGVDYINTLGIQPGVNTTLSFGKVKVFGIDNIGYLGHFDNATPTRYGVGFTPDGNLYLNAMLGKRVSIRNNNVEVANIDNNSISLLKPVTISSSLTCPTITSSLTGNASTATKLKTAHTIDITGDITATAVAFDGSDNISISASVNNDSHTHDTRYYTEAESNDRFLGINESASSYPQMLSKDRSSSNWIKTTQNGLLPQSNGVGAIGTSSWRYAYMHANTFYEGGVSLASKYSDDKMPVGTIIMFDANHTAGNSGDSGAWVDNSTMPGWYACVSANSARNCPNLVDRFVMGKGISGAGGTGGANTRTLSVSNMPSHAHTATHNHTGSSSGGSHHHGITGGRLSGSISYAHASNRTSSPGDGLSISNSGNSDNGIGTSGGGVPHGLATFNMSTSCDTSSSHSHTISVHNKSMSTLSTGSGSAFNNKPAYYSIIFIRKCS